MGDVFLLMYEFGTLTFVEVILRKVRGNRGNNGGDEPCQCTFYVYMEVSQNYELINNYYK
jgi:hypothetical protein